MLRIFQFHEDTYPDVVRVAIFLTSARYIEKQDSNLAKNSRALNHWPASIKIHNESALRLVQNFVYNVFYIESILPAEF